jgi:hypothetical protein
VVPSKRPAATAAKEHRGQKKSAGAAVTTKPDRAHAAILDLLFNGLAV